ncbi:MAG: dihydrodipicolinate synthase family protein [Anaerolineales bacterium]|nr:dihydrodipicolinate synthase family protein [Anaerolineales bacterium]MCB8960919.1 dihydrodipicolinate synthase family protein [Ardenticatenales bacterium]MCB0005662.1 dihydrodipicolinate synthase family protein [Anaerolineales bacterium]MCB0011108.1 dihydrodipicolinate synthase family protein [Anaerolineales bacterium]MCB0016405.1 dihydrodipicolinate synthase family protein [Anaerolineales bacterium]
MDIQEVKNTLCGPMIPVITHLNADLSVNTDAIRQEVNYLVEHGLTTGNGVLLAVGAGGDFNMLSVEERKQAAQAIVDGAAGRVPVLVGAQDTNVNVIIEMAKFAEEIGAYGIQTSTPYYYPPSDEDALAVYRAVHDATSRIAIMAYNTFWHDYDFPFEVLDQLCELERLVALKWARPSNGTAYLKGVARYADRLAVVDNAGLWVMNHMLGGTGFITHLATIWPEHDLEIWHLLQAGEYRAAQQKQMAANWVWQEFRGKMARRTSGESPPVKAALDLLGRYGGPSRLPGRTLNAEERAELKQLLQNIGVPGLS